MPKYLVCVCQESYIDFEIEAANEDEATDKVLNGEGEVVGTSVKFSQIEHVSLKTETNVLQK